MNRFAVRRMVRYKRDDIVPGGDSLWHRPSAGFTRVIIGFRQLSLPPPLALSPRENRRTFDFAARSILHTTLSVREPGSRHGCKIAGEAHGGAHHRPINVA